MYWNLVWFLERANIDNHLPDLLSPNFSAKYQSTDPLPDVDKLGKSKYLFIIFLYHYYHFTIQWYPAEDF